MQAQLQPVQAQLAVHWAWAVQQQAQQAQQAQAAQADPEEQEREQAMEQWLRRVPDDPSGLLREKFRYESRQRQEQGARRENESYW